MLLNFYENVYHTLNRQPEQVYIRWPRAKAGGGYMADAYTGADLLDQIAYYQLLLGERKISAGDRVLLALPVGIKLICGILAIMAVGAVPVLPPAGARPVQLFSLLRRHHIKGVLLEKPLALFPSLLLRILGVRQLLAGAYVQQAAAALPPVLVVAEQPALISHSSGSTGKAKAVFRSHRVLQAQHQVLKAQFPPLPQQRDFPLFPNILLHNLSLGVLSILPALPQFDVCQMNAALLLQQLQQEKAQTLTGNVFYFSKLLQHMEAHNLVLPQVQALGIGGSPVPEKLLYSLQAHFPGAACYVIYGSSEAEPIAVRKLDPRAEPYPPQWGYVVGPFCAALEWRIVPLAGSAHARAAGEIEVRGPHVATADTEEWLKTGDFGYVHEEGVLILSARKGNEIPHQGVQHYQIEHLLLHQQGVERAAARSLAEGFVVYVQGNADRAKLLAVLEAFFPKGIILALHYRDRFPMDSRHHSKILYTQLS